MPPGTEDVPGPMVEDGPPAQVSVQDAAPVPEDQQDGQSMMDLSARSRTFNCQPTTASDLKRTKDRFSPPQKWF